MNVIEQVNGNSWVAFNADCVEVTSALPDNSIDYSVFSPPFSSLYSYSPSARDMGNCKNDGEFFGQFVFLLNNLMRIVKPGRLVSMHCMNLPTSKVKDGYIGIRDFRGDLIRWMQKAGFIFHSEVTIWKDPVTAMQRTKALGLLYKQLCKDSAMSRQGIPDYLVTFRKPGENPEPVTNGTPYKFDKYVGEEGTGPAKDEFVGANDPKYRQSIAIWQRYASPVWMDIDQSRTLNVACAREEDDCRHLCALQLDVIERCIDLWTNPNNVVLSPFMGIGSEGYVSLQKGRRFVGVELKPAYYKQAVANLRTVEPNAKGSQLSLLG